MAYQLVIWKSNFNHKYKFFKPYRLGAFSFVNLSMTEEALKSNYQSISPVTGTTTKNSNPIGRERQESLNQWLSVA